MTVETTDSQLVRTKLSRPRVTSDLVPRPRLLERLSQRLWRPLTLVSAPAGYGKTTLVSTWLETWDGPNAWLSLDVHDSDLTAFLNYLVAAIQTMFPRACQESAGLLRTASLPPVPVIAGTLLNELSDIDQPYVLVLDDYHTIREQSVHELLRELLRHPPEGMRLVLVTRRDPLLPLARMRAQGLVTEIRTEDLRFTTEEATALLQQWIELPLDEATVSLLERTTEGWVTGLRLVVLSVRHRGDLDNLVTGLHGSSRYVTDYLMSEVLTRQPPEIQDLLVKSSILDRFCAPLCDAVRFGGAESLISSGVTAVGVRPTEPPEQFEGTAPVASDQIGHSGQAYLEKLAEANLFLVPLDDEGHWFRYHHLFQQFLLYQLEQRQSSDEIAALHARASGWFAQSGLIEEAMHHALAADDTPGAVQMVAQHRHRLMNRDQWQTLSRWLRLFPTQVVEGEPELLMVEAWLKQMRTQLADLPVVLDRVEYLLAQSVRKADATRHLLGEIDVIRAIVDYYSVEAESALVQLNRAQAVLPRDLQYVRNIASMYAGYANQMAGHLNAVTDAISAGLLEVPRNEMHRTRLLITLSIVYWMEADLDKLRLAARRCIEAAQKANSVLGLSGGEYFLGCAHYQHNDLDAAERHFRFVVERPYLSHGYTFAQASFGLASTYQALGRPDQARQVADSSVDFVLKSDNAFLLLVARAYQAELAARQGRLALASRWASQASPTRKRQAMTGFYGPQLTLPKILLAQDTVESRRKATGLLAELRSFVESIHNTRFLIEVLGLQALLHQAQDEESAALDALEQAIILAQPGGLVRLFVDLGPNLEPLLIQLSRDGVAPAYLAQILAAFRSSGLQTGDVPMDDKPQPAHPELVETLTNREMDVLLLLAERKTNKEIAGELGISTETVKRHASNLYRKLGVRNRRQAVARARGLGLVPAD